MDKKTYEALARIMSWVEIHSGSELTQDRWAVLGWMAEIEKEIDD